MYHGAAMCEGRLLNYAINQGPKVQQDLTNILLRLRQYRLALVQGIAEMYLRISVKKKDQPYHRIIWKSLKQSKELQVLQFTRVIFDTIHHHFMLSL